MGNPNDIADINTVTRSVSTVNEVREVDLLKEFSIIKIIENK